MSNTIYKKEQNKCDTCASTEESKLQHDAVKPVCLPAYS